MIFSDEQSRDYIRELQRLLYEISYHNKNIPLIIPDGIYGTETKGAVRIFQQEYDIPVTGNVDFDTWEKLTEVNSRHYPVIVRPDIFRSGTRLRQGSTGAAVYLLQHMMNTVGKRYANIPKSELNGEYDEATAKSVGAFEKMIHGDGERGEVGVDLWNVITAEFNKTVM